MFFYYFLGLILIIVSLFSYQNFTGKKEIKIKRVQHLIQERKTHSNAVGEAIKQKGEKYAEAKRIENMQRLLITVCRSVWVEARRNHCLDADVPAYVWKFLPNTGTIEDVANSCFSDSTFDCSYPERYGCYLLKQRLAGASNDKVVFDSTGITESVLKKKVHWD